jgi:hypothetical protein
LYRSRSVKTTISVLLLVMACFLTGCGHSKITKANFEKLKEGMTKAEVVAILGEPTGSELVMQIGDDEYYCPVWEAPDFKILIMFSNEGKLRVKRIDTE